jgi:hypothetical protein
VSSSTISGNNSTSTGGIAGPVSSFPMSNTIATGNTPLTGGNGDCTINGSPCNTNGTGGNVVGVAANLAALGNYGGPTQTMIPLPGSVAICAIAHTGAGFDQRGMPWPVSYSGTSCQDSGAVQTDYSLSFSQQPPLTTLSLTSISPDPAVELQESGIPFAPAVTIPLTLKDNSGTDITSLDLSGGSAATSSGVATYSPLDVNAAGTGDTLTAKLMLNSASTPATAISTTSSPFDVTLKPTTIVASDASAVYIPLSSQNVTLSATVTSSYGTVNAGTVTFTVMQGSTPIGSPVTSGTVSSSAASTVTYTLPAGTTAGTYTIQAVYNTGGGFATSIDSTHTLTVGMITVTPTLVNLTQIYTGSPLAATATTSPSGLTVNFTYNGSSTAPTAVGSYTVVGTVSDVNYQGSNTGTLVINQATPVINWATLTAIPYGTALSATQLDASSAVAGTYVYSPAAGAVLGVGPQNLKVTFTPTDSSDYTTATVYAALTVDKGAPAITWATPAAIPYGTALSATQLDANTTVAGTYVYTPAAGTVLSAGSQNLSVTFTPTDSTDYFSATFTVQLTVNKATPAITWATPAAIPYGTALSATQLNANSTVAGTFVYTPAAGTVLSAGSQNLSVTFTPTDLGDYTTATATVTLMVNKTTPTISWAIPAAISYGTALSATQLNASSTVAGTFVYTPAAGTVLSAGSQNLSVTFTPTDSGDYTTATATVTLMVNKTTPTISWATPAAISYGTALSATQLNAISTVDGTYIYSPLAGVVPTAGSQTLSVTFTPTDLGDYTTATATVTLTVNKATAAITLGNLSQTYTGSPLAATATTAPSGLTVNLTYNGSSTAPTAAGSYTVVGTISDTNYQGSTSNTLVIDKGAPAITWATPAAIPYGTALSATQLNANSTVAGTFVYTPAAGTVLSAGSQNLSVTFTPTDLGDYTTATATVTLMVNKTTPTISWAIPAAISYGTALSATQLNANSTVAGTFVYTPAAGTVLSAGSQNLSVTFTPTDLGDYTTATATVTLMVNKTTPTISWAIPAAISYGTALSATQLNASSTVDGTFVYTPAAGTVLSAGSQNLSVTFTPTDSGDYTTATATVTLMVNKATAAISWAIPAAISYGTALSATQLNASSTVDGTYVYTPAAGMVLGVGTQTLSVTLTPTDGTDYNTATSTVQLTVNKTTAAITLGNLSQTYTGSPLTATATTSPSGLTMNFTYNGNSTAPTAVGSYTVVGTVSDVNYQGSSSSTLVISKATPAITWATPVAIPYGTTLSATQLDANTTVAGTYVYTPAAGTVLSAGSQNLLVTFMPTDLGDYTTATVTVTLTVNKATPAITWATPAAIPYGTALSATQLDASSTVDGTFVYTPAAGVVLGVGPQTLSVTLTPTDSADYTAATVYITLVVNKGAPAITWGAPAAISYGTALSATQLNAISTVAGTYVYTPAAGTVLTAGSQNLSVTFTPTDSTDYFSATFTVQLTVNKATPAITWATPAAIPYGTALSATQLNANSTVAGTFVYTPAAGVVLGVGPQTLSVTLTPNDSADYTAATGYITLVVNKGAPAITWATPAAISYGTALSATQLDASSLAAGTFVYTPAAGVVLGVGTQTLTVTLTPTDGTDYNTATSTVQLVVNALTQTISFTAPSPVTYGSAPITLSATGGTSGNPITFSILSGPGSITGSTLTINGAGSVVVAANQAGNATYAAAAQVTQSIVVNPAPAAIAVANSASTVLAQNAVTLTATVSSPAGVPTGTVSFLDGTTPLGPGTLSGGVATLTTSSLAVGMHSISAVYSGGTNFAASTSATLTQCVMDISLGTIAGGSSQTTTPGGSAIYSLVIAPSSGTSFPVAVTLTVNGLPASATASVTPAAWALSSNDPWTWTLPANTPLSSNSQLTIQLPQSLAQAQPKGTAGGNVASRLAPYTLALLILPFAGRMRRAGKRLGRAAFVLLMLIAGMAAMAGLSGCGSPSIFFTQQLETYPVTVTVSAGSLSHSMPITLVVE